MERRHNAIEAVLNQIKANQKPTIKFSLPKKMTKEFTLKLNKWILSSDEYLLYKMVQKLSQGGQAADFEEKMKKESEKRR